MSEHQFPDIGRDPLKLSGKESNDYAAQFKERLNKAHTLQQQGVPDQTALVWRIDLMRLCGDHTWREAGHKAAIAAIEAENWPWVACAHQMPENEQEVIVWSPGFGFSFARKAWEQGFRPDHWEVQHHDSRWEMEDVTHWMPLPAKPKGES